MLCSDKLRAVPGSCSEGCRGAPGCGLRQRVTPAGFDDAWLQQTAPTPKQESNFLKYPEIKGEKLLPILQ